MNWVLYARLPMWLGDLLWISYVAGSYGMLRAWWVPYLLVPDADRAARYQVRFSNTHAFLPTRNGIRPDTLHVCFHAVFLATGAGLPQFLGIAGEHLNGVYSANEFLTRVNLMRAYQFPEYDEPVYDCRGKDVIVVGGGNTALDAVRTALRLGARSASIFYRRTEAEMPARKEEVAHAKAEGVQFHFLVNPLAFEGDEKGWLKSVTCSRMELGEMDASGRRRPVPVQGSEFETAVSLAIIAVGTTANPLVQSTTPDLATNKRGYIVTDADSQKTSKRGVFAGGDIVTGAATVILAMGAGRNGAKAIHDYLTTDVF